MDNLSDQENAPIDLEPLAIEIMQVMRRYGHELRNVTADRRGDIKALIEKLASKEEQE